MREAGGLKEAGGEKCERGHANLVRCERGHANLVRSAVAVVYLRQPSYTSSVSPHALVA